MMRNIDTKKYGEKTPKDRIADKIRVIPSMHLSKETYRLKGKGNDKSFLSSQHNNTSFYLSTLGILFVELIR